MIYDAFISYATEDRHKADLLAERLRHEGLIIAIDRRIALGAPWRAEIDQFLTSSWLCCIILGPHYLTSPYCLYELGYAAGSGTRFIPILWDDIEIDGPVSELQYFDLRSADISKTTLVSKILEILKSVKALSDRPPSSPWRDFRDALYNLTPHKEFILNVTKAMIPKYLSQIKVIEQGIQITDRNWSFEISAAVWNCIITEQQSINYINDGILVFAFHARPVYDLNDLRVVSLLEAQRELISLGGRVVRVFVSHETTTTIIERFSAPMKIMEEYGIKCYVLQMLHPRDFLWIPKLGIRFEFANVLITDEVRLVKASPSETVEYDNIIAAAARNAVSIRGERLHDLEWLAQ